MTEPVIEGEIVAESTALAVSKQPQPIAWVPTFALAIDEAVEKVEAKHTFFKRVMREGDHYGVIPGTGTKPALLKPGAELLLSSMGLYVELSDAEPPIRDYDGTGAGAGEALIAYRRICRVYRQTGPEEHMRMCVARAEGYCTSRESKYRYRNAKTTCPHCGKATIFKSKNAGEGWYCWKKKDGCGATFKPNEITPSQEKVANPDIADQENTILKMADKRALVAAALLATGCSDIFTQDIEENHPPVEDPPEPPADPPSKAATSGPKKISDKVRGDFMALYGKLPPEEFTGIIKDTQKHYGHDETGNVADLHEGDESRDAYKFLLRAVKKLNAA